MNNNKSLSYIYLTSYAILLFSDIFRYINISGSFTNLIFKIGIIIFFVLNIFIFLMHNHFVDYYFIILIVFIFISIFGYIFNFKLISIELLELVILLSNANLVNLKKFINLDLIIKIVMFIIISLLNILNILPTVTYNKGLSLGFSNSDIAGDIVISIVFSLLLLFNNELLSDNAYHYIIVIISMLIILLFYNITQFRSMLIVGAILLIFMGLVRVIHSKQHIMKFCISISILIPILSIFILYKFNPYTMKWHHINKLLSNRLIMQYTILQEYPLRYFGHHISQFIINSTSLTSLGYNFSGVTIDNFYLSTIYYNGIIGAIILVLIIIRILYTASKYNEYIPYTLLMSLIICSCMASGMLNTYNLVIMIYIIAYQLKIKSLSELLKDKNTFVSKEENK